ncbi:MAG: hypothetical protein LBV06_03160 [Propionibacteriaceae bacterium]|jgi:tetratricopeptide (TPR) repeat protein|nr:hypothetical protein [Propionibacteriaceae bacterium]
MAFRLLEPVVQRLVVAESGDRDPASLFMEGMFLAECTLKAAVAGIVAGIHDDPDRYRYRYEHKLVRATGIGDWSRTVQQVASGPAYGLLADPFQAAVNTLTRSLPTADKVWQCVAVEKLVATLRVVKPEVSVSARISAQQWLVDLATLRNRTRGHGALTQSKAELMWPTLKESVRAFVEGFPLFQSEWAYLHRNNSGKYKVVPVSDSASSLDYLKSSTDFTFTDGIYVATDDGRPMVVSLILSDSDLTDFWFANGNYNDKDETAEWFSYASDNAVRHTAVAWSALPTALPGSHTEGKTLLDVQGQVFGNLPPSPEGYVDRPSLESELRGRLGASDWHRVVTLVGAGGSGKTTLTLAVLHGLAQNGPYETMLWFSSRDVDLTERGPISVVPKVLTLKEISLTLWSLMHGEAPPKQFDKEEFLARQLQASELGACLFIFDNFETIEQPVAVYDWLNAHIGAKNKILITTRLRSFKGDYPVEVAGMTRSEFGLLVDTVSERLGIVGRLSSSQVDDLFAKSDGHPYITKLILGHIAVAGTQQGLGRIIARREDVLDALFERSFKQVTPLAQCAFLTLCGWRSVVPRLAIEAVLIHSVRPDEMPDTSAAVDQLANYSLIELISGQDDSVFVRVPNIARLFGQKKLEVNPSQALIRENIDLLQLFGAMHESEVARGYQPRLNKFLSSLDDRINTPEDLAKWSPTVETIARSLPDAWLKLADWEEAQGSPEKGLEASSRFLEALPQSKRGWKRYLRAAESAGDIRAQAQALISYSRLRHEALWDVFGNVNRLNGLFQDLRVLMEREEREALYSSMLVLFDNINMSEMNPTQLSLLAWLAIHAGKKGSARKYVAFLQKIDPENKHLPGLQNIY